MFDRLYQIFYEIQEYIFIALGYVFYHIMEFCYEILLWLLIKIVKLFFELLLIIVTFSVEFITEFVSQFQTGGTILSTYSGMSYETRSILEYIGLHLFVNAVLLAVIARIMIKLVLRF